jgi:quercetin dioxygenase-like cupin family protein
LEATVSVSPIHAVPGQGRALWHLGALLEFKATGQETDGRFWLAEQTSARGYASPVHRHSREDELFIILDGQLRVQVGDEHYDAPTGAITYAPRGLAHGFQVTSDLARFMILTTPAGFEEWFFQTGEPARERVVPPMPGGPPDIGKLVASLQAFGVELIAPPPGMEIPAAAHHA